LPRTLPRSQAYRCVRKMLDITVERIPWRPKSADREWEWSVWSDELTEFHKRHHEKNRVLVDAAESSGDLQPTGQAEPGKDLTDEIRT